MRNFDLAPLYRSTIGFDRLVSMMNQLDGHETPAQTYPPYNIEKRSENDYRISVAVAGFEPGELSIETRENTLLIRGEKADSADNDTRQFLFHGIAARQFERRFQLADHVRVGAASLENGLLHIDLNREVPDAMKPRQIAISTSAPPKAAKKLAA